MIEDDLTNGDYEDDIDDYYYEDDEELSEEPFQDVCQGCGCYFNWDGVMRQEVIQRLKIVDGASYQRCYKCLEN